MLGSQTTLRALSCISKSARGNLWASASASFLGHGPTGVIGEELNLQANLRNYSAVINDSYKKPQAQSQLVKSIMQQASVKKLREELEDEAENSMYITYDQFAEKATASGAAASPTEVAALCETLQGAGILLKLNNLVYLRIDEIINKVSEICTAASSSTSSSTPAIQRLLLTQGAVQTDRAALPGDLQDARVKLEAVDKELSELEKQMGVASNKALLVTNTMLTLGFIILFTQFLVFIYLTWWELSWDVMEPFSYIIQLFYSLVAYAYFMLMRGAEFDLSAFREFWVGRITRSKAQQLNVNQDRYETLRKLQQRYRRHLSIRSFRFK
eukprot:gene28791-31979_t